MLRRSHGQRGKIILKDTSIYPLTLRNSDDSFNQLRHSLIGSVLNLRGSVLHLECVIQCL